MDTYQQSLITGFFSHDPQTSPDDCHHFAQQLLDAGRNTIVNVTPCDWQGSSSYTCIADETSPKSPSKLTIVQFRHEKVDLWGNTQATQLHGSIAPPVEPQGCFKGLYVYTSPFAPGIPYVSLMASEDQLSLDHRFRTIGDLAKLLTRGARPAANNSSIHTSLSDIMAIVASFDFRNQDLKRQITESVSKAKQQDASLARLPHVLTHTDLTLFNFLVEAASGQLTAILDWDDAKYLPIGHNFHFIENVFGFMTRENWEDMEDREILESFFYDRVCEHLVSQGIDKKDLEALEQEKKLGTLIYFVPKLLEWEDGRAEKYLQHFFVEKS